MSWPDAITLLRPWWLLALPLAGLLGWRALHRARSPGDWARQIDPALMQVMRGAGHVYEGGGRWRLPLTVLTLALCLIALAGPAIRRDAPPVLRNSSAVILVVDLSDPVATHPNWPSAQAALRQVVAELQSRPAALVVFAGDAYLAQGLSRDHRQLGFTLSLLEPGLVPDPGARADLGLAQARAILRRTDVLDGHILLLSDQPGILRGAGERLTLIDITASASQPQTPVPVFAPQDVAGLTAHIRDSDPGQFAQHDLRMLAFADLGRWILLLALGPALLLFRRNTPC